MTAAAPLHVLGLVTAPGERTVELDVVAFRALGAAVGEVVLVEIGDYLCRGELEADASGVRVRCSTPLSGKVARVRRRRPEAA